MTNDERADWLARAIDEIIRDGEPPEAPASLDPEELASLLDTARLRLQAAQAAREAGADHESNVWARLVDRLDPPQTGSAPRKARKRSKGPPEDESGELRHVIGMRMQIAREALEMAEEHRDEVWKRLRSRLGATESAPALHARLAEEHREATQHVPAHRRRAQDRTQPATPKDDSRTRRLWRTLSWHYAAAGLVATGIAIAAAVLALT